MGEGLSVSNSAIELAVFESLVVTCSGHVKRWQVLTGVASQRGPVLM